jgi:hypothetical protein
LTSLKSQRIFLQHILDNWSGLSLSDMTQQDKVDMAAVHYLRIGLLDTWLDIEIYHQDTD